MRAYLDGPLVPGEPLRLIVRAEADDGTIGDARLTLPAGADLFGVPHATAVTSLQAHGWVDVPPHLDLMPDADRRYYLAFGRGAPQPASTSEQHRAEVIDAAIAAGKPIPHDFDWWAGLPDGAVA